MEIKSLMQNLKHGEHTVDGDKVIGRWIYKNNICEFVSGDNVSAFVNKDTVANVDDDGHLVVTDGVECRPPHQNSTKSRKRKRRDSVSQKAQALS